MGDYFKKLAGDPTWDDVAGGSQLPCYETIVERDAAYPAPMLGQKIGMRRLCGNGYFEQMYNGTRWESFGSIIRDAGGINITSGYAYTSTGTAYVALASYVIPRDIIGSGESWEIDIKIRVVTTYSGPNYAIMRIGGAQVSPNGTLGTSSRTSRICGEFTRDGATLITAPDATSLSYTASMVADVNVDMDVQKNCDVGITAAQAGNLFSVKHIALRRIA